MTDDRKNTNEIETGPASVTAAENQVASIKTIVVNGRDHRFAGDEIGRYDLSRIAFPTIGTAGRGALTVAYDRGPLEAPSGILSADRKTRVLDGQTFSVSRTDKS